MEEILYLILLLEDPQGGEAVPLMREFKVGQIF